MKNRLSQRLLFLALIALAAAATARATQVPLIGDAHVSAARLANNFGALSNLYIGNGNTSLLQFDLSALPPGVTASQISHATLTVFVNRVNSTGNVAVSPVTSAWSESAVTYATIPSFGVPAGSFTASAPGQFVTLDVTSMVRDWITTPASNFGFALSSAAASLLLDSKENDETSHAAALDITITSTGATGAIGPQGVPGTQGTQGPLGPIGSQGVIGATGATGSLGMQGATGTTGLQGLQGVTGAVGFTGAVGATGSIGLTGATGAIGLTGATGSQGAIGAVGATGAMGFTGATGSQGTIGATGTTGAIGLTGATGSQGAIGTTGATGAIGLTGATGSQGAIGTTGATGAIGLTGATGSQGAIGTTGATGAIGLTGATGSQGAIGAVGATGAIGLTGATGSQGAIGATGTIGQIGTFSEAGTWDTTPTYAIGQLVFCATCSTNGSSYIALTSNNNVDPPTHPTVWAMVAQAGAQGTTGAPGSAGLNGLNGTSGATGATGPAGATGATGSAGSATSTGIPYTVGSRIINSPVQASQDIFANPAATSAFNMSLTGLETVQTPNACSAKMLITSYVSLPGVFSLVQVAATAGLQTLQVTGSYGSTASCPLNGASGSTGQSCTLTATIGAGDIFTLKTYFTGGNPGGVVYTVFSCQ